jgi:archaellum component FlaG (FlaF/FlaG flagellin family)
MEFWFRVDSGTGTLAYNTILDKADGGPSGIGPWWIQIRNNGGVFSVGTHISSAGGSWTSWDIINNAYLATISANTWYHYALVRNGSTFTIYLNGTSIATATNSNALWESTSTVSIGARQQNTKSYYFGGNIDELRITKGIARYTSNFEVPDKELTDSPGDVNKKVVVDDEAKGLDIGEGGVDESRMAEAWVTFDGNNTTTSSPEIFDSYNVSAITDNGMGDYTIHYSQELNSANSCAIATIKTPSYEIVGNPENHPYSDDARADVWEQTSTYVKVRTTYGTTFGQGEFDSDRISVVVFAN